MFETPVSLTISPLSLVVAYQATLFLLLLSSAMSTAGKKLRKGRSETVLT
jgi:hypothetical protein